MKKQLQEAPDPLWNARPVLSRRRLLSKFQSVKVSNCLFILYQPMLLSNFSNSWLKHVGRGVNKESNKVARLVLFITHCFVIVFLCVLCVVCALCVLCVFCVFCVFFWVFLCVCVFCLFVCLFFCQSKIKKILKLPTRESLFK